MTWCAECGVALDPDGTPRPDLPPAPGADLEHPCVFCAQRAATGEVDARLDAPGR